MQNEHLIAKPSTRVQRPERQRQTLYPRPRSQSACTYRNTGPLRREKPFIGHLSQERGVAGNRGRCDPRWSLLGAGTVWGQQSTALLGQLRDLDPTLQESISMLLADLLEAPVLGLEGIQRMSFSMSLPSMTWQTTKAHEVPFACSLICCKMN